MAKTDSKLFDIRIIDRNLKKGLISESDYQSHLKALPDDEANATLVQISMEDTEIGGDLDHRDNGAGGEAGFGSDKP